jgi:hypothetical protein
MIQASAILKKDLSQHTTAAYNHERFVILNAPAKNELWGQ